MPDHHNDHDQDNSQNHDDCDDCKRERAENDKLIAIYEKLQEVDKRSSDMKESIVLHHHEVQKNKDVLKTLDQKVENKKSEKTTKDCTNFAEIGYNLYAEAIINAKKSEAQKQNQRLKRMLKKIYDQKCELSQSLSLQVGKQGKISIQMPPILPQIHSQSQSFQWFQKGSQTSRSESRRSKSFLQTSMEKSFEIFSTKSSFNMTKRKTFEKKDFQELNLWLFEQRNEALQQQLYESPSQSQEKQASKSPDKQSAWHKGVQRYVNNAKNTQRLGVSTVLRSSLMKQSGLIKKRQSDGQQRSKPVFNKSKIQSMASMQPEKVSNSGRFFNRGQVRGRVLPAIVGK